MSGHLSLTLQEASSATRILLSGRLDYQNNEKLRKAVRGCLLKEPSEVVLDMTNLTYLDSLAMGAILSLNTQLQQQGKHMVLDGAQGMVRDALRMANFHKLLELR